MSRKTRTRRDSEPLDRNTKRIKLSQANEKEVEDDVVLTDISEQLLLMERNLATELGKITFRQPVEYVYSPLEYAFDTHAMYVRKYCSTAKKILFLGMNPGPWGMSQTGVPFGEISMVRDWLKISGPVGKPAKEQPDRKVTGFQCTRSEVSGKRLWGLFRELCGNSEKFFKQAYIHNYCPIAWMDNKGRNITPAEIKGTEIEKVHSACDKVLADTIRLLKVETVIGIGIYAEKRAKLVVQSSKLVAKVLCLPHPSPRAANNKNWSEKATKKLSEFGLLKCFTN
ncbi:PREDICTED: single-strand selective monofunctional uracil DNA glycosylase [Dufourea novaeangliae]|uniref:single-strand selective monofunctional uracil DNA glycosylase n=1 Tax=Dufourea novaeangliae TaxID=178035 RepID=UPI00076792D0|nr:PREDICTED: single-strand selective monofunctional uracil DNA glycosylase [Dufourea novaeangliae]